MWWRCLPRRPSTHSSSVSAPELRCAEFACHTAQFEGNSLYTCTLMLLVQDVFMSLNTKLLRQQAVETCPVPCFCLAIFNALQILHLYLGSCTHTNTHTHTLTHTHTHTRRPHQRGRAPLLRRPRRLCCNHGHDLPSFS